MSCPVLNAELQANKSDSVSDGDGFTGDLDGPRRSSLTRNQLSQLNSSRAHDEQSGNLNKTESDGPNVKSKREVYRYQADWLISSVAWANESGDNLDLAISSYKENYKNYVQLIRLNKDSYNEELHCISTFEHPYPATKVLWVPKNGTQTSPDRAANLIATTADYLRIWRVTQTQRECDNDDDLGGRGQETEVTLECLLNSNQGARYCAPLTSFDWNQVDPSIIVTSSVDTTCAIWDIERARLVNQLDHSQSRDSTNGKLRTQLVAHDHQVYDVSFSQLAGGRDVFVTAGGDGSVRQFDLRNLSNSTILFEDRTRYASANHKRAFVRVCCSKKDENIIGTFAVDSNEILLLDVRYPRKTLVKLCNHTANLNSISWAPHSAHHICSGADDNQALIWELKNLPEPVEEPLLAYRAKGKINTLSWSASHSDWIAIGFENCLELLRV